MNMHAYVPRCKEEQEEEKSEPVPLNTNFTTMQARVYRRVIGRLMDLIEPLQRLRWRHVSPDNKLSWMTVDDIPIVISSSLLES